MARLPSEGVQLLEHRDNGLRLHALAKFDIDLPRLDQSVLADNEFRRDWQEECLVTLVLFQIDTGMLITARGTL